MRPIVQCSLINGPLGDPVVYADIMFERRALLFDIGDIAALPARKLLRVSHVFVSHAHMDHFADFDRLLRHTLGRDKTIALFGPAGFIDQVGHKLAAYTWNVVHRYPGNLTFDATEVHADGTLLHARFRAAGGFQRQAEPPSRLPGDVLTTVGPLRVRCAVLDHATPCLGFAVEEPAHVNIWKNRLDAAGLHVGPWLGVLKQAILSGAGDTQPIRALRRTDAGIAAVDLPLGRLRDLVRVVAGQTIGYVVDVRGDAANRRRVVALARGADLLFIECAFLQADADQAAHKNHLTAWQAGSIAREAGVKRLIPCHFSTRYADRAEAVADEAQHAFAAAAGEAWRPATTGGSR